MSRSELRQNKTLNFVFNLFEKQNNYEQPNDFWKFGYNQIINIELI